ncbi:MAG: TIGR03619 family F420-dependent LLM class oxidoreductase, partial [Candidatus Binataceae bacterium]
MKFGTFITSIRPDRIAENIRQAEKLGYESAWIGEHLIMPTKFESRYPYSADGRFPSAENAAFHDPMLALAYAAAVTEKIKLATGIFVLPMRNPIATAKAVASLDILSKGRLIFGVGIGWFAEEFAVSGASFNDRALRTREYLELMTELFTKDDPVYHGKTVNIASVRFYPKPLQQPHPPYVFGGTSEPALKRSVRLGDGWYGIATSLEQARDLITRLREHERTQYRSRPLEITLSLRTGHSLTIEEVARLAEMGVERALVGLPRKAFNEDE